MRGWMILAAILLLLVLLTMLRVGAEVTYDSSGLRIRVRLGRVYLTLYPRRPRKKKPKPPKKPEPPKEEKPAETPPPRRRGGLPIPLTELLSLGAEAAGRTLERLQIDTLALEYLIGGRTDPAGAAMRYGGVYAGGGLIVPLLENTFYRIRHRDIQAWIDFDSDESLVWMQFALSIRINQLISIGWAVVVRFLSAYLRQRKENKKAQEGMKDGTEAPDQ